MFKFCVRNTSVGFDFTFFATVALFLSLDKSGFAIMSVAACVWHEFGHLVAALLTRTSIREIRFYGGGILLARRLGETPHKFTVTIAGCLFNFAAFAALYYLCPGLKSSVFGVIHLIIGLFNLLPAGCLDGKNLLEMFCALAFPAERAALVTKTAENVAVLFIFSVTALLLALGYVNFTLAAVILYLFVVDMFV